MSKIKRNVLLNPGPGTTTDTVKQAQIVPDICPREKDFSIVISKIRDDIAKIATQNNSKYSTILFGGSGTAGVESAISSIVPHNKKILIINNGAYGKRMVEIAETYDINYAEIKLKNGKAVHANDIQEIIDSDKEIEVVAMVHHETSSGILNDVQSIGQLTHKLNKTLIVDSMSSFGGIPFDIDECNIDFLISSSNKCLQSIAGIFFIIANKVKLDNLKNIKKRSLYLDLYSQYLYFEKTGQFRFTPPVQALYALKQALIEFFEEGLEQRYIRYTKSWEALRQGIENLGLKIITDKKEDSHILISIEYPKSNFNFEIVHDTMYKKGFTIYPGKMQGKNTFRLANMGAIDESDIKLFLSEFEKCLKNLKVI